MMFSFLYFWVPKCSSAGYPHGGQTRSHGHLRALGLYILDTHISGSETSEASKLGDIG